MSEGGHQRIDKWLWFARFARTRTLAQGLATSGRVRVNRNKVDSASHAVRVGDVLTIACDRSVRVIRIAATAERRGGAPEARRLYEELTPAPSQAAPPPAPAGERTPGSGRPTKRDRRRLISLKQPAEDEFSSGEE
jgi:ribosome-associated heat shock protein Hsp15